MRFMTGDRRSYDWYWWHHIVSPPRGTHTADSIEIFGGGRVSRSATLRSRRSPSESWWRS